MRLGSSFGCRVRGVELRPAFADDARRRAADAGLASLIATFVWGTIAETTPVLRGFVPR